MKTPTFPQLISLAALVGAVVLFALHKEDAGLVVLAFAGGQLIPSPIALKKDEP